jgi:phytanoyl-CoA hydroxylase
MKQSFNESGFIVIKNFFDESLISQIKQALDEYSDYQNIRTKDIVWEQEETKDFKYIQNVNYYIPICHRLISNKLLKTVSELLGEDSYFVNMEIHNKVPFKGTYTPAHQDNFYFRLSPPSALTAYIPIELHNATINGGLKFLVGSNKLGTIDHTSSKVKAFSSLLELDGIGDFDVYHTDLQPGDIVFHHANTVHFADANESEFSRRSFSVRLNGLSAKVDPKMHEKYAKNYQVNRG